MTALPFFAIFPPEAWRSQITSDAWIRLLDSWATLVESHHSLPDESFKSISVEDPSLAAFLASLLRELAEGGLAVLGSSSSAKRLLRICSDLTSRLLRQASPANSLVQWEFLADYSKVHSKEKASSLLASLSSPAKDALDTSLVSVKRYLVKNFEAGLRGNLEATEQKLGLLNHLIRASPSTAVFFLSGSDFLDGLICCSKILNPAPRKVVVATAYLCLIGLVEHDPPRISLLTDQLYSLKTAAADVHKASASSAADSMVAELVTATPLLQQLEAKLAGVDASSKRTTAVIEDLKTFRKPGGMVLPQRVLRRRVNKGKGVAVDRDAEEAHVIHVHRMRKITQIQDLFPQLGSGFVAKALVAYDDEPEQVIAHIIEGTLPKHLKQADQAEELHHVNASQILPIRQTSHPHADIELDQLPLHSSQLHFGKRTAFQTADTLLSSRATAPTRASILAALATFDPDDDERDDTYDAADVGGTVDATVAALDGTGESHEESLFRVHQADPGAFARDAVTRRSSGRERLRESTGMTDEEIEGWAIMLERDVGKRRRLEARYAVWDGVQAKVAPTGWRRGADEGTEGREDEGTAGGAGGGLRGWGGKGGRGGGNVACDQENGAARRRKEASKGTRANHNRREGRARKMARGGFLG